MADGLVIKEFRFTINPRAGQVMSEAVDPQIASSAKKVLDVAKTLIGGKGFSGHHTGRGKRLRNSGAVVRQGAGSYAVVFTHDIALYHHQGTLEHEITAKRTYTNKKGKTVPIPMFRDSPTPTSNMYEDPFGPALRVEHPGTDPNPYLTNAAKKVGLRLSGSLKRGTQGPFPIGRSKGFF